MWNMNRSRNGGAVMMMVMRHLSTSSRKRAPNLRKINPRVPYQEATCIAEDIYGVIKINGPLTVSNTWNHLQEARINGVSSKTHMKLLLKWMQGRSMLKQFCTHVGSSKKFLLTTLPEDSNNPISFMVTKQSAETPSKSKKKQSK